MGTEADTEAGHVIADAGPDATADATTARDAAKRPGRPRSERAEQAIIEAALEAFAECGVEGVRCEDVAARAGVGKATLYRRWPGKEELLIAALAALKSPLPRPRGETAREDLTAMLDVMARDCDDPRYARQFALLHGEGERYPRLIARYKQTVVEPRREMIRSVLRRGVETGEFRPDTDIEIAMLTLTGAVMSRGKHDTTEAAPDFATRVVDQVLQGIASLRTVAPRGAASASERAPGAHQANRGGIPRNEGPSRRSLMLRRAPQRAGGPGGWCVPPG